MNPAGWIMVTLGVAFYLYPVIEAATLPSHVWPAAGYRRSVWMFYLIFLPGLLTILYLLFVRPKLYRARFS